MNIWSAPATPGSPARQPRWGGRSGDGALVEGSMFTRLARTKVTRLEAENSN